MAMVITDYHVQSVLRTYSRQLQRAKLPVSDSNDGRPRPAVKVSISEEAHQRLLMERIESQALEQVQEYRAEDVDQDPFPGSTSGEG
jgi:hypothetical protein